MTLAGDRGRWGKIGKGENRIKKPKTISNEDAKKIREHLNTQDRLIFDLSIETGLRISDILELRRNQIAKTMSIRESKTKKYKTVEISDELLERLPKGFNFGIAPYVFKSPYKRNKHIHRSSYHRRLKKVCNVLKIAFSAHSTRKLYARNIFERTNNIFAVQEALQHKYVTTTAAYLDIDIMGLITQALNK